jgi:hypothetical protein
LKYAAGCFGCLALMFFGLYLFMSFGLSIVLTAIPADMAVELAPVTTAISGIAGIVNAVSGSCCCLSAVAAVVFLAVGSMGGNSAQTDFE